MPKVSVIIPVYNAEKYIKQCLDSIINQTLEDIEIICVDDGSIDNSLHILKDYSFIDKRIKIISQTNQYAGIARNNGLKIATGEYVHFMDSDDYLYDNTVYEQLYKIIKSANFPNIIRFRTEAFDCQTNKYVRRDYYENTKIPESLIDKNIDIKNNIDYILMLPCAPWSGFCKREFIQNNKLEFCNLICCNDRSFFNKIILSSETIFITNFTVVKHRINNKSSLIGIRGKYFDCEFKNFDIIKNYMEQHNIDEAIRNKILIYELNDVYSYYNRDKDRLNIQISTIEFAKTLDLDNIFSNCFKNQTKIYKFFKKLQSKSILICIISYILQRFVQVKDDNKKRLRILTIFGIKIKFKMQKK